MPEPTHHQRISLEAIQGDRSLRQRLFPVVDREIFLAHAGVSPLPQPAVDAITNEARNAASMHQEVDFQTRLTRGREVVASLFGVRSSEVALLGPTSLGLGLIANGIDWRAGDEIVYYPDDYPANVYPWRSLDRLGVRAVPLRPSRLGQITPDLVAAAVTPRCRLVALASAHFLSGEAIDTAAIGKVAHDAGALFCLDGIQTLGAVHTPLDHVDFVAADSHKWMLGPLAAGILIVKEHVQPLLRPALLGADNIRSPHFIASEQMEPIEGAVRYEAGVRNMLGIVGMTASLELIASVGIASIERHLTALRREAMRALGEKGFEFLSGDPGQIGGGILTFRRPGSNSKRIYSRLVENHITASLRWTRDGSEWIRFSPHLYITPEDMRVAVDSVVRFA